MLSRFDDARILIIDDTPANVELLTALLRRSGLRHLYSLTDPRDAFEHFDAVEPDLVILDLHMPWVDGFTILREIVRRAAGSYLPVLVITADTTSETGQRALREGAKDLITKPFHINEVLLRVANLLETRVLHQHLRRVSGSLADQLGRIRRQETADQAAKEGRRQAIRGVLDGEALRMVFQPIVDLDRNQTMGWEALARFEAEPRRGPDQWFADAADVGLGPALELAAIARAVDALPHLPDDAYLAVNTSAQTLLGPELLGLLGTDIGPRLVVELTEHTPIEDYPSILQALGLLRDRGVRLAVDDTGAGYASLRHILTLAPDIIKLDQSLVRGVSHDPARRALASALVSFAADTGTQLIAEGVETRDELAALAGLGVRCAQGYHLGRPAPLAEQHQPSLAAK